MKDKGRIVPETQRDAEESETRIVELRIQESDFRILEGLARARRTTVSTLIIEALPLVIEKFRVLRALNIQPDERAGWRRRNA